MTKKDGQQFIPQQQQKGACLVLQTTNTIETNDYISVILIFTISTRFGDAVIQLCIK